jgi:hypothetical protein
MCAAFTDRSNAMATGRWQLWIDRGGGYDILQGERFSIGGPGGDNPADIAVRCPWTHRVATLVRSPQSDWLCETSQRAGQTRQPLLSDQELKIGVDPDKHGPRLRYLRPSPLSGSAVITAVPPHRLFGPADAMVLLDQTVLLGPESFNHVHTPALSSQGWVLFRRGGYWWIRGTHVAPQQIEVAHRWQFEDWSFMIREI